MAHDEGYHPRLVVTEPSELAGTVLTLDQSQLVIGHSDTADLVLEDRFVSRRHALVTVDSAGQVTIRDLNSLGGTFVNDERLAGPRVLLPGDIVRFTDLAARFEPAGAPEAAVTRAMPAVSADGGTAAPVTAPPVTKAPVAEAPVSE